jgi:hypothetical protein
MKFFIWDELSGWGLGIKSIYFLNALAPMSEYKDSIYAEYPPALQLFSYLFLKLSGQYSEHIIFWSYQVLIAAILVSVLPRLKKRQYFYLFIVNVAILIIGTSTFFPIFQTIYADPLMGLIFGFSLIFAHIKKFSNQSHKLFFFSLILGVLVLIKPIGIFFSIVSMAHFYFVHFNPNFYALRRIVKHFSISVLVFIPSVTFYIIWTRVVEKNGYETTFNFDLEKFLDYSIRLFTKQNTDSYNEFYFELVTIFSDFIQSNKFINLNFLNVTLITWIGLFSLIYTILFILARSELSTLNFISSLSVIFLGLIIYIFLLFYLYLTSFVEYEALRLASIDRYIFSYLSGIFLLLTYLFVLFIDSDFGKNIIKVLAIFTFFLLVANDHIVSFVRNPEISNQFRKPLQEVELLVNNMTFNSEDKVWIITQHKNGYEYYAIKYFLFPTSVNKGSFSIGTPYGVEDVWTDTNIDFGKFEKFLQEYDFILIHNANLDFSCQFGKIFNGVCQPIKTGFYKFSKTKELLELVS